MSHSTKSGFKARRGVEDPSPLANRAWSWREGSDAWDPGCPWTPVRGVLQFSRAAQLSACAGSSSSLRVAWFAWRRLEKLGLAGVCQRDAASLSGLEFASVVASEARPSLQSRSIGVGQSAAAAPNSPPDPLSARPRLGSAPPVGVFGVGQLLTWFASCTPWATVRAEWVRACAVAVPQDEDPLPEVRRADLRRREQTPLRIEPEIGQGSEYKPESSRKEAWDVLQEHDGGSYVAKHPVDLRPDPTLVLVPLAPTGDAPRLAREARSDAIHKAAPSASVEGSQVVPHRRRIQGAVLHARDQDRGRIGFPLHVTDGAGQWLGQSDAEFESSDPGTKSQDIHSLSFAILSAAASAAGSCSPAFGAFRGR